nr:TRAP transporter large permease subunit [Rhodoligotrophos defluvii]
MSISENYYVLLFMITIVLLIMGMFIDDVSGSILAAVILLTVATNIGVDPVHFAGIVDTNLALAMSSRPARRSYSWPNRVSGLELRQFVAPCPPPDAVAGGAAGDLSSRAEPRHPATAGLAPQLSSSHRARRDCRGGPARHLGRASGPFDRSCYGDLTDPPIRRCPTFDLSLTSPILLDSTTRPSERSRCTSHSPPKPFPSVNANAFALSRTASSGVCARAASPAPITSPASVRPSVRPRNSRRVAAGADRISRISALPPPTPRTTILIRGGKCGGNPPSAPAPQEPSPCSRRDHNRTPLPEL